MKPANGASRAVETAQPARRLRLALPPALKFPAYRNFWLGMVASVGGFQVLQFGQFWLVHELTGSPLALGYVGLANAIPAITLNLVGGVVADRFDKRRLIVVTQTLTAALIATLAALTFTHTVRVWHIIAIAVAAGAVNAFNQPARMAIIPHLVDRPALMSAVALNSSVWQGTRIVAPMIAGGLIALFGTASAFWLAAVGNLAMVFAVLTLDVPRLAGGRGTNALTDLVDGLSFIKRNSIFSFLIGMTFFNSFFGMAYIILMPVFAVDVFHVGADGQGVLMSAGGIGSLLVTLWLGTRKNFRWKGLLLIGGAVMTGISLGAFALTAKYVASYQLAIILMFFVGAFTSSYMISIMSSLQMLVPDRMRGRVMGFYGMTWNIMPLGGMWAGALAGVIGAPFAIAIGAALVAAFAIGPASLNSKVRNLGGLLDRAERGEAVVAAR
ncbi:MAG: MFS transporter [Chloroflexi bacterium]|nr:MFS transporter [Chloroflexota bacterium]